MKTHNKTNIVLSVTALLSLPFLPSDLYAQAVARTANAQNASVERQAIFMKLSNARVAAQKMDLVAILNGEPLFKSGKGELFVIDPATGDIKNVEPDAYSKISIYIKMTNNATDYAIRETSATSRPKLNLPPITVKMKNIVSGIKVLGTDRDGHLVQETSRGEKFYLDPNTGDMIDWEGHAKTLK